MLFVVTFSSSADAETPYACRMRLSAPPTWIIFARMDKGYFREEGLNIEVIRAPGGVATPGLLSGQFQFSSSASSSLSAAVRGGPVKIVYTNLSRPSYALVSIKPEISFSQKIWWGKKSPSTVSATPATSRRFFILRKWALIRPRCCSSQSVETKSVFPLCFRSHRRCSVGAARHRRVEGPKTCRIGRSR